MNLSELLLFLNQCGKEPKKGLSQNFLIEKNVVSKIIRTAEILPHDLILEIGPGAGALTKELLNQGAKVFAVEKDRILSQALEKLQTNDQRLVIFNADFLKFDLASLPSKLKVVANLPYSITTPILEKLLNHSSQFHSFTLMIQKEVAERIMAPSGSKQFGSLSLFLQFYTTYKSSFSVSASCFYPRPKVDSTVIRCDLRTSPLLDDPKPFFALTRRAFQQRRKMISSSLKELYSCEKIQTALAQINARKEARPESLSLEDWLAFYTVLMKM